jgi:hypothetical protein
MIRVAPQTRLCDVFLGGNAALGFICRKRETEARTRCRAPVHRAEAIHVPQIAVRAQTIARRGVARLTRQAHTITLPVREAALQVQ